MIVVFRYVGHEEVVDELRERRPLLGVGQSDFGILDLGHVGFEHVIRLGAQLELVHPGADLKGICFRCCTGIVERLQTLQWEDFIPHWRGESGRNRLHGT